MSTMRFLLLFLMLNTDIVRAWSGHVCEHFTVKETNQDLCVKWSRECDVHRMNLACCELKNVTVTEVQKSEQCCLGWEDPTGNETCTTSTCTSIGHCNGGACGSSSLPCYPGFCKGTVCKCSPGFSYYRGACLRITTKPSIVKVKFSLMYINGGSKEEEFKATAHEKNNWVNWKGFNAYTLMWDTFYIPDVPSLRPQPNATFYIYSSSSIIKFMGKGNSSSYSSSANCEFSKMKNATCTVTKTNLNTLIKHGSRFEIQVSATNRGDLWYRANHWSYYGESFVYKMNVNFDYAKPLHHLDISPMNISPEISKGEVNISWPGWVDDLSGIDQFVLRIYKLHTNGENSLVQPISAELTTYLNNMTTNYSYTPGSPGVYSYVLEIIDRAGNKEYTRRYGIYDSTSAIETNEKQHMHASSASERSNYGWQSNTDGINITWKNYFFNKVQRDGFFLDRILRYPTKMDNNMIVLDKYDDLNSIRSFSAIANINGITRFEYILKQIFPGAIHPPSSGWINVSENDMLSASMSLEMKGVEDGHGYRIWMRAHDIMNHAKIDHIDLYFDTTPPKLEENETILSKNIRNSVNKYKFATRIVTEALDEHSGISQLAWVIKMHKTKQPVASGYIEGNKTPEGKDCQILHSCYETPARNCFCSHHAFEINHCDIDINKTESLLSSLILELIAYNGPYLNKSINLQLGTVSTLTGVGKYNSVNDVKATSVHLSSVLLTWDFHPSCYNRTKLEVSYGTGSTTSFTKVTLAANARSLSIANLDENTKYKARFVVFYGEAMSDSEEFTFKTAVPGLYITGLVLEGCVILIGIAFLLIYRFCRRLNIRKKIENFSMRMSDVEDRLSKGERSLPKPVEEFEPDSKPPINLDEMQPIHIDQYEDEVQILAEDNIYDDLANATMETTIPLDREKIKFLELLHEGCFSTVVSGTVQNDKGAEWMIGIKYPNMSNDEAVREFEGSVHSLVKDLKLMGHHQNILNIYGTVIDGLDPPMLIMELCQNGCLRHWLDTGTEWEDDNKVHNIAVGVASGMYFLSQTKQIVHGDLTSYNVLLTEDFKPKIKDYIPTFTKQVRVQWAAPEVLTSSQMITRSSSDVWSYGVILWELFNQGKMPYADIAEEEILQNVEDGYRMEIPESCTEGEKEIMHMCWQLEQLNRPSFKEIIDLLNENNSLTASGLYSNT